MTRLVRTIRLTASAILLAALAPFVRAQEPTVAVSQANPIAAIAVPVVETLPVPPALDEEPTSEDDGPVFLHEDLETPDFMAERVEFDETLPEDEPPLHWAVTEFFFDALTAPDEPLAGFFGSLICGEHYVPHSAVEDHAIGIQPVPSRPDLILESNERFLGSGELSEGIELPTGAVWRPSLWVFGTYRAGVSYLDIPGGATFAEMATRLDLFAQLNLSGTERFVVGIRPFDKERSSRRSFTSYDFRDGRFIDAANADIQTLFFEGDLGEIFPNSDPYDTGSLDYGFSVGRQPMSFQQGLLINEDLIDALTVTRNTGYGDGNLNLRVTSVYAWNEINRNNNVRDQNAQLFGIFTESDFELSTVNADVAYVSSESHLGSLFAYGLSAIQRLKGFHNTYNTSFHVLGSIPTEGETIASGKGELLFSQISWTPHHTNDLVYLNGFWAIDQFTSPARGTLAGGPLGQTGILFAAAGLGRFGAPLNNQASKAAGASLGYQLFFDDSHQQVVFEIGGRKSTDGPDNGAFGIGTRWQKKLNQHWILVTDGFVTKREGLRVVPGARIEVLAKF